MGADVMTDDEAKALGMRATKSGEIAFPEPRDDWPATVGRWRDPDTGVLWQMDECIWPDFRDPATLGVLRAQAQDAGRWDFVWTTSIVWEDGRRTYGVRGTDGGGSDDLIVPDYAEGAGVADLCWSEAAALVAALEAAA